MSETILESIIKERKKKDAFKTEPHVLLFDLFRNLKEGEKDILIRRFGLLKQRCETLEQVGRDRGVTRERIRQIEKNSVRKLKDIYMDNEGMVILKRIVFRVLEEYGGLMREEHLLDVLLESLGLLERPRNNREAFVFILGNLFDEPNLLKHHPDFYDSWHLPQISIKNIQNIISQIEKKIREKNEVADEAGLQKIFDEIDVERNAFDAYLSATKKIEKNSFGQWGIASWPTVSPKRISDKAYLVFKNENKPLHFTKVAELINKASFNDRKIANVGTVHNELIMDGRYILIGRGTYVLKEWGYSEGTVSQVIVQLLKEMGPMDREEIVERVSKQRMVHDNTIKVALIDRNLFKRISKHRYGLADE
jgi:hypothetical protein